PQDQQKDLTFLELPPDLQKAVKRPKSNIISDKDRVATSRSPVLNHEDLKKALAGRSGRPALPAASQPPAAPAPQQAAPQPTPPPQPPQPQAQPVAKAQIPPAATPQP